MSVRWANIIGNMKCFYRCFLNIRENHALRSGCVADSYNIMYLSKRSYNIIRRHKYISRIFQCYRSAVDNDPLYGQWSIKNCVCCPRSAKYFLSNSTIQSTEQRMYVNTRSNTNEYEFHLDSKFFHHQSQSQWVLMTIMSKEK
jgi:hypothetical protein